jgi:single-strand DNA-binding protein
MFTATIAGKLGKDAETRNAGQTTVTSFRVAIDQRGKDGKVTTWVGCSMWGKRGEAVAQYLTKGSGVCVSGELTTREYDSKTQLEVNVSELTLMGGGQERQQGGGGYDQGGNGGQSGQNNRRELDDEIPF